jgi:hypothetical protein
MYSQVQYMFESIRFKKCLARLHGYLWKFVLELMQCEKGCTRGCSI